MALLYIISRINTQEAVVCYCYSKQVDTQEATIRYLSNTHTRRSRVLLRNVYSNLYSKEAAGRYLLVHSGRSGWKSLVKSSLGNLYSNLYWKIHLSVLLLEATLDHLHFQSYIFFVLKNTLCQATHLLIIRASPRNTQAPPHPNPHTQVHL